MNRQQAMQIVLGELNRKYLDEDDEIIILEGETLERPYGWIFFCDSRRHTETGSPLDALGGNGPVVVEAETGRLTYLGSGRSAEVEIAAYEAKLGRSPK